MRKLTLLLGLVTLPAGCAHTIAISPTLSPTAMVVDKRAETVAVYFAPDIASYRESATPSSWAGSAHTYNFTIGPSLCSCLLRSVETAYRSAVKVTSPPSAGDYERVLKFSMQHSNLDVYFQDGFLSSNAKSNYSVTVLAEAYDGVDMALIAKTSVSGSGFGSRGGSAFSAEESFAQTVQNGVQQVCDGVASMLISGFAEPRCD